MVIDGVLVYVTVFLSSAVRSESVDVDSTVIHFVTIVVVGDGCTVTSVVSVAVFVGVDMESLEAVEDFTVGVGVSSALSGDSCFNDADLTDVVRVIVT